MTERSEADEAQAEERQGRRLRYGAADVDDLDVLEIIAGRVAAEIQAADLHADDGRPQPQRCQVGMPFR